MTRAAAQPSTGFLGGLSAPERAWLDARGRARRYRKGAALFIEGEPSGTVLMLRSGHVKVAFASAEGRETILAVRGPGDILGELSALDEEPRSASAIALEAVDALIVSREDFRAFLIEHPAVAVTLLRTLSARLRDADRKRVEFGAFDATGRVAARLVELAERFGVPAGRGVRVEIPLSQQEIAGWVGASREAVARSLGVLRERGWIETARRGVTILDLDALRRRGV